VITRLRSRLGVHLELTSLFTYPQLSDLARQVELARWMAGAVVPEVTEPGVHVVEGRL